MSKPTIEEVKGYTPTPYPPVEWDGKSTLPPIGSKVYTNVGDDIVTVMVHGKGATFCGMDDGGHIDLFDTRLCSPMKSDRAKAIEAAIHTMMDTYRNSTSYPTEFLQHHNAEIYFGALYDKG
jgi:hypothetical protein